MATSRSEIVDLCDPSAYVEFLDPQLKLQCKSTGTHASLPRFGRPNWIKKSKHSCQRTISTKDLFQRSSADVDLQSSALVRLQVTKRSRTISTKSRKRAQRNQATRTQKQEELLKRKRFWKTDGNFFSIYNSSPCCVLWRVEVRLSSNCTIDLQIVPLSFPSLPVLSPC